MAVFVFLQELAFTALGPMYLSSTLKKRGHKCYLFVEELEKDLLKKVREIKPDYVAFTTFTGQHVWALKWAKKIKDKLGIPNIMGGPHTTRHPDLIDKYSQVDIVCLGESEYAILELAEKIDIGGDITKIENLWVRKDGKIHRNSLRRLIENLDELPFPDRELYYKYKVFRDRNIKRFLPGRGCPYKCIFCHNPADQKLYEKNGTWARKRSPENMIQEIEEVKRNYPALEIADISLDDHFLNDRKWALDFLKLYKERLDLPFLINTRPETINEEVAIALRDAGCRGVGMSIETADPGLRNKLLKKFIRDEEIIKGVKLLKKNGIIVKTYNMIGIPGETLDQAFKTLKMNMKLRPFFARCSILSPYPGTELYKIACQEKLIDETFDMEKYSRNYMEESLLKLSHRDRLVNLQKFFSLVVAFPFLFPFVKQLIKFPPNKLYDKIGTLSFGFFGARYFGYTLMDMVRTSTSFMKNSHPP